MQPQTILDFWFSEMTPQQWWEKDAAVDRMIRQRFSEVHASGTRGELFTWRTTAAGRLAEIIILDQFSRNMFRDSAQAFAQDTVALVLAQEAVSQGADKDLPDAQRSFMYMPYMHSESLAIHEQGVALFSQKGMEYNLEFELKHKVIIETFGRYPHRNVLLGRESTEAEIEFLKQPNSVF